MPDAATSDHRPRVAAERRERTRARLVESALLAFARRGTGSSVIQEVIAHAEVSQGTFYNYFKTNEELLAAVSEELSDELLVQIEALVWEFVDPARRVACGVRMYLHTARDYPVFARFVAAAGLHAAGPTSRIHDFLPPDLAEGDRTGRFAEMPAAAALDLIAGATLAAVGRLAAGDAPPDHPEAVAAAILRGLGVPGVQAKRLVLIELPRLRPAPDSLLARAQLRA